MRMHFTYSGTLVIVRVTIWITRTFDFTFDAGSDWAAMLLVRELDRLFAQQMQRTRETEYNAGYRDHKKRVRKRTQFTRFFSE